MHRDVAYYAVVASRDSGTRLRAIFQEDRVPPVTVATAEIPKKKKWAGRLTLAPLKLTAREIYSKYSLGFEM